MNTRMGSIAEKIKELRTRLGMSQADLAKRIGDVDQTTVSKWERGRSDPNVDRTAKLAELAGQTLDEWIGLKSVMPIEQTETRPMEWKSAFDHRKPDCPLLGYAPGDYIGRCTRCKGKFIYLDKRAYHCLPCAIEEAMQTLHRYETEMRALQSDNETLKAAIQMIKRSDEAQAPYSADMPVYKASER